jgi:glutamine amidotransferase
VFVGVIDLGINNLTSVERAFTAALNSSDSLQIIQGLDSKPQPDLLILPGLGKFGSGMGALENQGLIDKIKVWNKKGTKVVGICLGMQLLGSHSDESPGKKGLGFIEGRIERLPSDQGERIPHIGWAEAKLRGDSKDFSNLMSEGDFYFVHSYAATAPVGQYQAWAEYGEPFLAAVEDGALTATQFHPEKSGTAGLKLISNWSKSL